jgi:long-chain-fatty-acid--CoA ligase ACSBG
MYGPDEIPADIKEKLPTVPVYTFDNFLKLGTAVVNDELVTRAKAMKPGHTCTLIYTSGTTGPPKAVMITHDNITWTVRAMLAYVPGGKLDNDDHMISFLPLSHVAAQMLDMHMPMQTGAQCHFAQPDALKGSLAMTLKAVRPTIFFGVPRVWEKFYDKLQEVAKASTGLKKTISTWAKGVALKHWESKEFGSKSGDALLYPLARKLLHKAHLALGFDRCKAFYVSAAPIEVKILKYFSSIDIPIMELFGQSECTGPHASNKLDAFKIGSVGRPLPGTETIISPDSGELCYRGRHIFAGYMKMEDKTKETVDDDGWLHSGDVVKVCAIACASLSNKNYACNNLFSQTFFKIDDDHDPSIPKPSGFVFITGRIKELIITAGGENVPPVLIEDQFKLAIPALSNCMVIGDKRKFLTILLCLQVEIDEDGLATKKLAGRALDISKEIGSTATTTDEVMVDPLWKEYLDKGMKAANKAATSRAQNVGKWGLLATDFTEKGGELTPTLKLKRSVAAEIHNETIEALYA